MPDAGLGPRDTEVKNSEPLLSWSIICLRQPHINQEIYDLQGGDGQGKGNRAAGKRRVLEMGTLRQKPEGEGWNSVCKGPEAGRPVLAKRNKKANVIGKE